MSKRTIATKISFKEVLRISCCLKSKIIKRKAKVYDVLKDFVISKLCIKELLTKFNEIDKLKTALLSSSEIEVLDELPNPFPVCKGMNNLWKFTESNKNMDLNISETTNMRKNELKWRKIVRREEIKEDKEINNKSGDNQNKNRL